MRTSTCVLQCLKRKNLNNVNFNVLTRALLFINTDLTAYFRSNATLDQKPHTQVIVKNGISKSWGRGFAPTCNFIFAQFTELDTLCFQQSVFYEYGMFCGVMYALALPVLSPLSQVLSGSPGRTPIIHTFAAALVAPTETPSIHQKVKPIWFVLQNCIFTLFQSVKITKYLQIFFDITSIILVVESHI